MKIMNLKQKIDNLKEKRFFPILIGVFIFLFLLIIFIIGLTLREKKIESSKSYIQKKAKTKLSKKDNNEGKISNSKSQEADTLNSDSISHIPNNDLSRGIYLEKDTVCLKALYEICLYYYKRGNYSRLKDFIIATQKYPYTGQ